MSAWTLHFASHSEESIAFSSHELAAAAKTHRAESIFCQHHEKPTLQSVLQHLSTLPTSHRTQSVFDLPAHLMCPKMNSTLPSISYFQSTSRLLFSESSVSLHPSLISLRRFADGIAIDHVLPPTSHATSHATSQHLPFIDANRVDGDGSWVDGDANGIMNPFTHRPHRESFDRLGLSTPSTTGVIRLDAGHLGCIHVQQGSIQLHLAGSSVKRDLHLLGFQASASTRWQTVIELQTPNNTPTSEQHFTAQNSIAAELGGTEGILAERSLPPSWNDEQIGSTQAAQTDKQIANCSKSSRTNDVLIPDSRTFNDSVRYSMLAPYLYPKANTTVRHTRLPASPDLLSHHTDVLPMSDGAEKLEALYGNDGPSIVSGFATDTVPLIASQSLCWVDLNFAAGVSSQRTGKPTTASDAQNLVAKQRKKDFKSATRDSSSQQPSVTTFAAGIADVMHSRCHSFGTSIYRESASRLRTQASFRGSATRAICSVTGPVVLGNFAKSGSDLQTNEHWSYDTQCTSQRHQKFGGQLFGQQPSNAPSSGTETPKHAAKLIQDACTSLTAYTSVLIPQRLARLFGWNDPLVVSKDDKMFVISETAPLATESVTAHHSGGNFVASTLIAPSPQVSESCIERTVNCAAIAKAAKPCASNAPLASTNVRATATLPIDGKMHCDTKIHHMDRQTANQLCTGNALPAKDRQIPRRAKTGLYLHHPIAASESPASQKTAIPRITEQQTQWHWGLNRAG